MVHAQADDIPAGLADDGAGLAKHARRVADGGGQTGKRDGVALGLRRPLQVAPKLLAILELGEAPAIDGVHRNPAAVRLLDADDAVARHRRAALAEMQADPGREPAAAHIEPRAFAVDDPAPGGGGLLLGGLQSREDRLEHLRRGHPAPADAFEQFVLAAHGEAVERGPQRYILQRLAGRLEGLRHRNAAEAGEFFLLRLPNVASDRRAGAAGDGQRSPVGRHHRLSAADDLHHVAVRQRRAQRP